jgi:hypothetical protein
MSDKIFYSWQSDLPNRTNRGLIQSALEKATKDIRSDDSIAIDPVVDRDTLGEPGAPDIAVTILRKIDEATAIVCDVSIVCRPDNGRACPNPNVLVELGYALKSISSERVILVFNTAYGDVSELPFDLRFKRVVTYQMSEDEEPSHIRKLLRKTFKDALQGIFEHLEETAKGEENSAYLTSLNQTLTKIILFGEESRQRDINPWAQEVVDTFESAAGEVRELAAEEVAANIEVFDNLETLADQLDEVVDFPKALGRESWDNFNALVDNAVGTAWQIKKHHIDTVPLDEDSKQQVAKLVGQKIRMLYQWVARCERSDKNMRHRIFEDFLSDIVDFGYVLLQISYYKLDEIKPQLSETLRREAMPLHLIEHRYEMSGSNAEDEVVKEVKSKIPIIESFLKGII